MYVTDPILLHLNRAEEVAEFWRLWRYMKYLVERPATSVPGKAQGQSRNLCWKVYHFVRRCKRLEFYKEDTKFVSSVSVLGCSRLYECCVQHGNLLY